MNRLKLLSLALAILGITVIILLVGWYGSGRILDAILSVGWVGFGAYVAWQAASLALLGVAWWAIVPQGAPQGKPLGARRLPAFVWGRMVRDSASSCLPFSQLGGFVMGARAAALHGVPGQIATISTVVDLTAELVAEILFLVVGLVILLAHEGDSEMTSPLVLGLGAAVIAAGLGLVLQRRAAPLFVKIGRRMLGRWLTAGEDGQAAGEAELARMYGHPGRIAVGTLLHLAGWFAKGAGNFLAFQLLGAPVGFGGALAIEALLHAMLGLAFLVPGYAGVQEAGYASLGALFGASPDIALAVSLLRRARDLTLGLPVLLAWQGVEMRRLRRRASPA